MTALHAFALSAVMIVFSSLATAQTPPSANVRLRGEILAFDGATLTLRERRGETVKVRLTDRSTVGGLVTASLADIGPGKFIGTAALPQADGSLRALEVLIFPEAMRGTGEGHFPWDLRPQSTMTNATVADIVTAVQGRTLTLRYRDGEKKVVVPEGAPIVTLTPADRSKLVPGAHVFIGAAQPQPDGSFNAARVTVGLNGLIPPM